MPPWADTPYPLITSTGAKERSDIPGAHSCLEGAYLMAQLHNTIIRSINAVYNQAVAVQERGTKKDIENFLEFNKLVYEVLHQHHLNEEECLFPLLAEIAGDEHFAHAEIDEHRQFSDGAERYRIIFFQ